ncbi:Oidioi.mRNA.OKI2018_I69.chr1.g1300.t1.cds [Oikopleura dioica]|uniref:Oidioi.mRNA.OKI2018_I69.chr1.g1300.t1.cds n=1 Tax=Oikopleura dioica TaxID=34765 RepID=A0ABN7SP66_OIKDI|nr:Oidioi.mRNA.OKI2018_I69.chr1.g1300.t1.cds [Oikopleura dioica]
MVKFSPCILIGFALGFNDKKFVVKDDCDMKKEICIKCVHNTMHGFVKRNAINSFALGDQSIISLKTEAEFNSIPATNCNSNLSYDPKVDGFVFGIPLGECGMETEQKNIDEEMHITFTSRLNFGNQMRFFGGTQFYFGEYGDFVFNCNYRQWSETTKGIYSPVTTFRTDAEKTIDQDVSWDETMTLSFFEPDFLTPLNASELVLGETLNFQVEWNEDFSDEFPVLFHLQDCLIASEDYNQTFAVIEDGCGAKIISTELKSSTPSQVKAVNWSFRSFQFSREQINTDLSLTCQVNFCLVKDLLNGDCLTAAETCPTGYQDPTKQEEKLLGRGRQYTWGA